METINNSSEESSDHTSYASKKLYSEFYHEGHNLIDRISAAIYTCDNNGIITFYNNAAAEIWGRRPDVGKDLWCGSWKIYNTEGSPVPLDTCPMAIALKEGRAVKGEEIVIERPDGERINVIPFPQPIFDFSGNITGAINLLVDITEKRNYEIALVESEKKYKNLAALLDKKVQKRTATLKSSEERYHKMIEEVEDYAIILLDVDGTILNWNKGAEKIKGYTEKEIVGKNFRIFYLEKDRELKLPEQLIGIATEKGKAMLEAWRLRKNGTRFWGSISITALHDDNNNVIGFSKVTRDLTERKLAEEKLQEYAKELEFQNQKLDQYAFVASHDLQVPLRKITTYASILETKIDKLPEAKEDLNKIVSSAMRMAALINEILKYSRVSNTEELFEKTDLNRILKNVKDDFEIIIQQSNVIIKNDLLPVIKAIPIQIYQLFSNLIENAIKFSNENPVIEIISKESTAEEINNYPDLDPKVKYIELIFKDNGKGIESQYIDQIFNLFQRIDSVNNGTGIGLATCKKIVENHKGHIDVTSEVNIGSCFKILLPV
ncbi:MAG TPA: PAS domain S-box protein [Saprospiraceae bacterium]|nr:PAS domain S-box protein [Saprospiraceae bacterium]